MGLLAATALIWGSSFLLIEIGLNSFRAGVVAMMRVLLGASALALFKGARKPVDRDDLPRIALLGVVWIGLPMILFPLAQRLISSSVAGMINGPLAQAARSSSRSPTMDEAFLPANSSRSSSVSCRSMPPTRATREVPALGWRSPAASSGSMAAKSR